MKTIEIKRSGKVLRITPSDAAKILVEYNGKSNMTCILSCDSTNQSWIHVDDLGDFEISPAESDSISELLNEVMTAEGEKQIEKEEKALNRIMFENFKY